MIEIELSKALISGFLVAGTSVSMGVLFLVFLKEERYEMAIFSIFMGIALTLYLVADPVFGIQMFNITLVSP